MGRKDTKRHLLIAGALALEWLLAFAFARKFAHAVADANAHTDSVSDYWVNRFNLVDHEVRMNGHRLTALEEGHGMSRCPYDGRDCQTVHGNARE